ncbi:MAG: hypothetical protein QGH94_16095, partial [Phycisphaerae bacterium]|nr:hypothetical protein [Phycisphaerae bacterium]
DRQAGDADYQVTPTTTKTDSNRYAQTSNHPGRPARPAGMRFARNFTEGDHKALQTPQTANRMQIRFVELAASDTIITSVSRHKIGRDHEKGNLH